MDWINKNLILECLKELSDKSYQERVWMASSGPEISSFAEAMCQLYGDSGLDTAYGKDQVYGEPIDGLLKSFGTVLQNTPHKGPPSELIQDERMVPVRKMAAHIADLIERQSKP
jgi:hypothetical protein